VKAKILFLHMLTQMFFSLYADHQFIFFINYFTPLASDGTMINYNRKSNGLPFLIPIIDYRILNRKSLSKLEMKYLSFILEM
jgi:hypothetical protein